ncbi:MAG: hypothetical protein HC826_01650 [Rhodospirillales bacterium]|nr:hypothetical protein [Rhodospirillales bacterium]
MTNDVDDRTGTANQGEGNREAAKAYNEQQHDFVEQGRVEKAADEAREAIESEEKHDLERAEAEGKKHAKGVDPAVTYNPS